ncbi:hypothetical protein [uncultured Rhodoblastus sp.]|uniref:hypothetical protein n=1 Tax=uncultured Rhodoblastus sp. TaxID=543037 RepID=UPI0025DE7C81|nr:hypothetical protein [uncultured Rhodoblastus sp.]
MSILAFAALAGSWMIYYGGQIMEEEAKHPTCISDYKKCRDNEDIVRNHKSRQHAHLQTECKSAAKALSKYGEPEIPFFPFKDFWKGDTFRNAGGATLLEDGAIFPNANGGKMRVGLSCHYDLRSDIATVGFTP